MDQYHILYDQFKTKFAISNARGITCIEREIRLIDVFLLEGDASQYKRLTNANGGLGWDIGSVCEGRSGLLFAFDLGYVPEIGTANLPIQVSSKKKVGI